jgi:superfamily II DNA or RNA helicase
MSGYYTLNIADITKQRKNNIKQPFPHQKEAFAALSNTLPTPIKDYRGTLLVLPTGGGKTFTSVNWICRNILSKGIKVLWLAQSSYLIDQAADTFMNEIHNAVGRDFINLRIVSSSTSHSNSGSISLTDDVLICTTQTAISAYSSEQLDGRGKIVRTPFRNFVDNCKDTELFIVIDEAHHTPAYGCRTLLLSIREDINKLYVLGLTATPMHMDKRISGWLKNIFDKWICYEADKSVLQANKVLSVPRYIEKDTGMEFEVDDGLFDRLVNKHKDLPDSIIESLADNQARNNLIISDYMNNRNEYGKTLIFADRWFQCEYLIEKLNEQGIRANAVYSVVTGQDTSYRGGSGRRNNKMNEEVMQDFRDGKYDVIVNVKMLTEGVDVPDVKTVMITRQTTSNILLTQMIGRALRGEKAGGGLGKDFANIVFFHDTWKRLLPWADVHGGGLEEGQPPKQGRNPMTVISIQLIKLATADIEYKGFENADYLSFIPVGFFNCEYTVAIEESSVEELISFEENIVVYEFNKEKYERLIAFLITQDLSLYAAENITDSQINEKAEELADEYFDFETDGFDGLLISNVTKIIHHIAQNNIAPLFINFHERDIYDMDKLANDMADTSPRQIDVFLRNVFNDSGKHWGFFYKNYSNFKDAFDKSINRIFNDKSDVVIVPNLESDEELTDEVKRQVFARDKFTCLCCGKEQRKGVPLNADHIRPIAMGGNNAISNLQTLCKQCNTVKGVNEVDYRINITPLRKPKPDLQMFEWINSDYVQNSIGRIVNEFYHCKAMCVLNYHQRRNGQFYSTWEIVLYSGNDPEWLKPYENRLLDYVNKQLGWENVTKIVVRN